MIDHNGCKSNDPDYCTCMMTIEAFSHTQQFVGLLPQGFAHFWRNPGEWENLNFTTLGIYLNSVREFHAFLSRYSDSAAFTLSKSAATQSLIFSLECPFKLFFIITYIHSSVKKTIKKCHKCTIVKNEVELLFSTFLQRKTLAKIFNLAVTLNL